MLETQLRLHEIWSDRLRWAFESQSSFEEAGVVEAEFHRKPPWTQIQAEGSVSALKSSTRINHSANISS
jgi:hypothetical protein